MQHTVRGLIEGGSILNEPILPLFLHTPTSCQISILVSPARSILIQEFLQLYCSLAQEAMPHRIRKSNLGVLVVYFVF